MGVGGSGLRVEPGSLPQTPHTQFISLTHAQEPICLAAHQGAPSTLLPGSRSDAGVGRSAQTSVALMKVDSIPEVAGC